MIEDFRLMKKILKIVIIDVVVMSAILFLLFFFIWKTMGNQPSECSFCFVNPPVFFAINLLVLNILNIVVLRKENKLFVVKYLIASSLVYAVILYFILW